MFDRFRDGRVHVVGDALCIELTRYLVDVGPDASQLAEDGACLFVGYDWRCRRPLEVTALQELRDRCTAQNGFARNASVFIRRKADVRAGAVRRRTNF